MGLRRRSTKGMKNSNVGIKVDKDDGLRTISHG